MQIRSDDTKYVKEQYASDRNLAMRIRTHELYTQPPGDFTTWVLDHVEWQGDERVLDVGCGAGVYAAPVLARTPNYIAGDLSAGMLASVKAPWRVNMNAQALPFPAGSVDIVLANHMLYHVPDKERALGEFVRVLRPGGVLLATTNSEHNMAELRELPATVAAELDIPASPSLPTPIDFTLENGAALLARHFTHVERHDLHAALVFPEAEPVVDYLETSPRLLVGLPDGIREEEVWAALRTVLNAHLETHGEFRVNKLTGLFRCWNE